MDRPTRRTSKPHTVNSIVASAEVITARQLSNTHLTTEKAAKWQEDSWGYYDTVGEFRFGVNWLANAMSRINLVAARPPTQVGDEPTPLSRDDDELTSDEARAIELVELIAGGASGQGQLLHAFGQHLSIAGFGWLVAEPDPNDPNADEYETWNVYSHDGLKVEGAGTEADPHHYKVRTGAGSDNFRRLHPNALVVKCWRSHPRRPWEADAPVRGVLGVLQQMDLLSAHITATGESRLAGAGILAIPSEAVFPPSMTTTTTTIKDEDGNDVVVEVQQDPLDGFLEQLVEAASVARKDRGSAASVIPLTIQIPGAFLDKMQHIRFSTPFDDKVLALLEAAIKRLALGMDMPPEILTGMSGVNHWTAWQVEETAITLHIEPPSEIIAHALSKGYLRLAMEAEGRDPDAAMVWYDASDLATPPDRSGNVVEAYDRNQASGDALRRELGLSDEDAPDEVEALRREFLTVAKGAPTLAPAMMYLAGLIDREQLEFVSAMLAGQQAPAAGEAEPPPADEPDEPDAPAEPDVGPEGTPDTEPPSQAAAMSQAAIAAGLTHACDGVVWRAIERAGQRLRTAAQRRGGELPDAPPHLMHLAVDATSYADLDHLLDGAWGRVPEIAEWFHIDAAQLTSTLNAYTRALIATGHAHDRHRLGHALGVDATV